MLFQLFLSFLFFTSLFASSPRPNIILNPSGNTPLSAVYKTSHINKEPLIFIVKGKTPEMNIAVKYPASYGNEFPIHGLYPNYSNYVFIKEGDKAFKKYQINTKSFSIPGAKKNISPIDVEKFVGTVNKDCLSTPKPSQQDLFFVSLPLNGPIIGYDRKGEIRYFYNRKGSKAQVIRMECSKERICFVMIDDYKYYQKMDLLGNFIFREKMSVHHESIPFKNGQELILGNSEWGWEDMIFVLNKNKKIIKKWSIGDAIRKVVEPKDLDILNQVIFDNKNPYILKDTGKKKRIDWAHANSLLYDNKNDLLYISLRHQGIVAIKIQTWTLEFFIASDKMIVAAGNCYGKKPKESKFLTNIPSLQKRRCQVKPKKDEPRGQHAMFLRKNGEILFFDNQADNIKGTQGVSRLLQYEVNVQSKVASTKWAYKHPENAYTRFTSDVDVTRDQHILMLYGYGKPNRIVEINTAGEILYELQVNQKSIFYRIDKFPLYLYNDKKLQYHQDQSELNYSTMRK